MHVFQLVKSITTTFVGTNVYMAVSVEVFSFLVTFWHSIRHTGNVHLLVNLCFHLFNVF